MKKVLYGTLAAVTLLGSVSAASAQIRGYGYDDGFGYPSGPVYYNTYGWLTAPYDPNSPASIGYNRNIAEPTNLGG
jgi:hypothetical protein